MNFADTILAFFFEHLLGLLPFLVLFVGYKLMQRWKTRRARMEIIACRDSRDSVFASSHKVDEEIFGTEDVKTCVLPSQVERDLDYLAHITAPAKADYKPKLGYTSVDILYATCRTRIESDRQRARYGSGRGDLRFGVATVSIPQRHEPGQIERPRWRYLQIQENPRKHVVILAVNETTVSHWNSILRHSLPVNTTRSILLFVHGYNVTFDQAVRRTAQLAYDLAFDGIPILYSWPSPGSLIKYWADEGTTDWASGRLQEVLVRIARAEPDVINTIAHSMGNRLLTTVIRGFADRNDDIRFNQVVLAAADIDAKLFQDDLAPKLKFLARRTSVYASSGDKALIASSAIHAFPRVGQGGPNLVLIRGIDTIDASPIDLGLLGHGYFAENKQVIDDLFMLIRHGLPPESRNLRRKSNGELAYWVFP